MEPFEIMVSESQERMLCVVEPARLQEVLAVCARWEVDGTAIGVVTDTRRLRVFSGDALVGDMPVTALVDECPAYDLSPAEPATPLYPAPPVVLTSSDPGEILVGLLGSSNIASRKWAFEQYDSIVGSRTVRRPESADAAVLMLPPTAGAGAPRAAASHAGASRPSAAPPAAGALRSGADSPGGGASQSGAASPPAGAASPNGATAPAGDPLTALYPGDADGPRPAIAVAIDGNGRRVAADPYRGAVEAVLECSANLACVGAEPLGLTNCLNFGNPEKPHIAWQFSRAIAGLGDACRGFGIPVVGGNVSLYNEGGEGPIYPTPVVGLVGELPDARRAGRLGFAAAGDSIALVSAGWAPSLAASELSKLRGEVVAGPLPAVDLGVGEGAARRDPPGRSRGRALVGARCRRGRRRGGAGRVLHRVRAGRFRLGPVVRGGAVRRGPGRVPGLGHRIRPGGVRDGRAGHRRRRRFLGRDRGRARRAARRPRPRVHLRPGGPPALSEPKGV